MKPRTVIATAILAVLWAPAISQTGSMTVEGNGRIDKNVCKESDRGADGKCRTAATRTRKGEGGITDIPASATPSIVGSGAAGSTASGSVGTGNSSMGTGTGVTGGTSTSGSVGVGTTGSGAGGSVGVSGSTSGGITTGTGTTGGVTGSSGSSR